MHGQVTHMMRKTSLKRLRGYRVDDVASIGEQQGVRDVFVHAPSTEYEAGDEDEHRAEQNDQRRRRTVLVHLVRTTQGSSGRAG